MNEIREIIKVKLINDSSNNIHVAQALHNEATLNLLKQLCTKRAKSPFFNTTAMCLKYISKIGYLIVRKMMCKSLYISVCGVDIRD